MDPSMSDSYMDPSMSDSYMDPSMSDSYMDTGMTVDLNEEFINYSGFNENEAGFKVSISRAADGNISFTEILDPIDTLANHTSITFSLSQTFGPITVDVGTYDLYYYENDGFAEFVLVSLNSEGANSQGTEIFSFGSTNYGFQKDYSNGFEEFVLAINNESIVPSAPKTMLFDDYSTSPFVINIDSELNSYSYDDGGSESSSQLGVGSYLVNVKAGNVITLTEIVSDTDYDGVDELANEYTLWNGNGDIRYNSFKSDINYKNIIKDDTTNYETADQVNYKIDEFGDTWNSTNLTPGFYTAQDGTSIPGGFYKVSLDNGSIYLQATTLVDGVYDIDKNVQPYLLSPASSTTFTYNVNSYNQAVQQIDYKQYFYDLIDPETHNGMDVLPFMKEQILINGGTEYVEGETFDNTKMNFINTADVTSVTSIDAGENMDYILGGVGGLNINGGSGIDLYIASPASIDIVLDQNGEVIAEDGVIVDLTSSRVTYVDAGTEDKVSNIEFFMGSLGDDKFVGSALYDGDIDPSHTFNLQAFNPSKGKDEILGGEDVIDPVTGDVIKVFTGLDYDGMQGGQGVIFILDGSDAAQFATVAQDEISFEKISQIAGEYWSDTSWAGDGWLPSNDDILNENGNFSTVSRYLGDNEGVTLILDSFGDTDLAFNIDHYVGSGEADIFFGSDGNDSFDAASGLGNYMSGGDGLDQLTITDLNEIVSNDNGTPDDDTDDFTEDAGDNIDLDSIIINRLYEYTDYLDVKIGDSSGKLETEASGVEPTGTLYRIDFAEVADLSSFYQANLSTSVSSQYEISSEYALFLRTTVDLSSTLSGSTNFTFDSVNSKIDVSGTTDLSILDGLTTGQLVLAEEIVGGYIISGQENDGNLYSTVIEDVEQVSLLSDDVKYFGTGEITGSQEDIYQLMLGGQGDLGDMLYVATGETLNSTTGVGEYSAGVNFISGEVFYSGHHTDFDRNSSASGWANSVAAAFQVDGQDTARLWNDDVAQFFVWYKPSETADSYEIAVKYQNGDVNAWGIDNRQFDTFQNVTIDQNIADAINTQFGDAVNVELGEYRVLYEAAFTDIETLISSSDDVKNWNFDFQPASSRSTFYIQVGGDATGVNGSSGISDTLVTNVKVERIDVGEGNFIWNINPQAEILVNLPVLPGADENDNVMISGASAETIEAGKGSDIMMGRGGSDNYKIVAGDTLDASGNSVIGSYGVAGDVINEIGGSSEDKSDAITLSSAKSIDEITFSRTEIANEYWGNTLQIDVAYAAGGTDTLYVFDHYNQSHSFRAVEQLFLDDGWDSDEIWNLIVGDIDETTGIDEYEGTAGQDVLMAGAKVSNLYGGDGQDIMIGDQYSKETTFELGNKDGVWDQVADIIEGFGVGDKLDLSALGITEAADIKVDGDELQLAADDTVIAQFNNFYDGLTLDQILTEEGAVIYG